MKTKHGQYIGNVVAEIWSQTMGLEELRSHLKAHPNVSLLTLSPNRDKLIAVVPTTCRRVEAHVEAARWVGRVLAEACPPDTFVGPVFDPWRPLFEFFNPQDNKALQNLCIMRKGPTDGMGKAYAFGN